MSYYLAPALESLREEVNERFPKRDKASDGWVGDTSHSARASDHNPDWSDGGVVRAIDIDIDDNDSSADVVQMLLKAAIGDSRVYYIIYNRKIYSRTYGFRPQYYSGSNPHDKHVHISLVHTRTAERDTRPWLDEKVKAIRTGPPAISQGNLIKQFQIANKQTRGKILDLPATRKVQRLLNTRYKAGLKVDGKVGASTLAAWADHERQVKGSGRTRIPDSKSLAALNRGRYQLIK